jgi:hypothetical protein
MIASATGSVSPRPFRAVVVFLAQFLALDRLAQAVTGPVVCFGSGAPGPPLRRCAGLPGMLCLRQSCAQDQALRIHELHIDP